MINTVIFDLDGTLLNTLDDLTDSVNFMLQHFGYAKRTVGEVREFVGNGITKLVERAVGENGGDIDECVRVFVEHYNVHKNDKTAPYDGIMPLLETLKKGGYKTAIVSNKYQPAVKELCATVFCGLIDFAVGESGEIPPKPSPAGVKLAMQTLCSKPQECIYVGDSDVDFMTAQNSGLELVAVSWGFKSREFLKSIGAEVIIDRPMQLKELLEKW